MPGKIFSVPVVLIIPAFVFSKIKFIMRKVLLATFIGVASFIGANAQKGHNQIGIGPEVAIPVGDFGDGFKTGFGGSVKGMFGVGTAGQVTLTSGYTTFKAKGLESGEKFNASIIPILLGYRHNFNGFYVEPQAGYGIYGSKISGTGTGLDGTNSSGAFTWAAGIGYALKQGVDIGARYQSGHKDGATTGVVGFTVRYNFSLGGAKASK
jgi:hypothetical protein